VLLLHKKIARPRRDGRNIRGTTLLTFVTGESFALLFFDCQTMLAHDCNTLGELVT